MSDVSDIETGDIIAVNQGVSVAYQKRADGTFAQVVVLDGGGASSSGETTIVKFLVSSGPTYTLPKLPSGTSGMKIMFNGVAYADNGVDFTVSGLVLTVLNEAITLSPGEFDFYFQS